MRTNEKRVRLIHKRTAERKQTVERKKRNAPDAVCMAACLLPVMGMGAYMPTLMAGVAGLIGSHTALGHILMGLLAFLLGVCVTLLLYRLRRRSERKWREGDDDEL